jgi:hypothetical protein
VADAQAVPPVTRPCRVCGTPIPADGARRYCVPCQVQRRQGQLLQHRRAQLQRLYQDRLQQERRARGGA